MATKTLRHCTTEADVEIGLAHIEKGQQLAGHFPSAEALERARRVLTGELSPGEARNEMNTALARIVEEERTAADGR